MFIKDLCKSVKACAGLYKGGFHLKPSYLSIKRQTTGATRKQAAQVDFEAVEFWLDSIAMTVAVEPF